MKNLLLLFLISLITISCSSVNNGNIISKRPLIKTYNDLKWENVVSQQHDFLCGAASLATIYKGYFNETVSEKEIIDLIIYKMPKEELAKRIITGFTMLDLKNVSEKLKYQAVGAKIETETLYQLQGPIIILFKNGINHFVVFKGIQGDRVFIADPGQGNIRLPLIDFIEMWNGISLFLGKENFGIPIGYPLAYKAVYDTVPENF